MASAAQDFDFGARLAVTDCGPDGCAGAEATITVAVVGL